MSRRYDYEICIAQAFGAYLRDQVDADIQAAAPVCEWFDPMSVEESDRIIIIGSSGTTKPGAIGNGMVPLEVVLKTRFAENSLQAALTTHQARLNELRDKLFVAVGTLLDSLNAELSGVQIDYIEDRRDFSTKAFTDGWFVSDCKLNVHCFSTEPET